MGVTMLARGRVCRASPTLFSFIIQFKIMFIKPIVFFDLESTGTDLASDRIIDFGAIRVSNFGSCDQKIEYLEFLINPSRPILNSEIHGITDEMVIDAPTFKQVAEHIAAFMEGCDLAGYNIKRFDIGLLAEELNRAGIDFSMAGRRTLDQFLAYKVLNPQTLAAAHERYVGMPIENAHRAMADANASLAVFNNMIAFNHIPNDADEIVKFQQNGEEHDTMVDFAGKFTRNKDGVILLNFGQHKGKPAIEHPDFVKWMLTKDITTDTHRWCGDILDTFFDNN